MAARVLVADDEPFTAEMLALMLAFRGFEVRRAYDGAEALEQALNWKPDVLLLDVQMPELEGVDVTRAVRSHDEMRECPVILISSFDECEVAWRDAGANVFLQKPIDIVKLPDVVERLLHGIVRHPESEWPREQAGGRVTARAQRVVPLNSRTRLS